MRSSAVANQFDGKLSHGCIDHDSSKPTSWHAKSRDCKGCRDCMKQHCDSIVVKRTSKCAD
eukprot:714675-Pleurochrysis_carterae.AAC.1